MINKEINIDRCDACIDELYAEQSYSEPEELVNTENNLETTISEDELSRNTIRRIIQRCHGMFIKNETLQEKKRRLTNFVNQT